MYRNTNTGVFRKIIELLLAPDVLITLTKKIIAMGEFKGPPAIVVTNTNREILWVNDAFEEMTGYSLKCVYLNKPSILQGPNTDKNTLILISNKLRNLTSFTTTLVNYRFNKEEYFCTIQVFPLILENGQHFGFVAVEYESEKGDKNPAQPIKVLAANNQLNSDHKYEESHLDLTSEILLLGKVVNYLEENQRYRSPQSIKQISQALHSNPKYLSQTINRNADLNFRQFINSFRLRDFKELFLDPEFAHLTIEGMAYKCGFQNKATFFNSFRAAEGMTPIAFKKKAGSKPEPTS